jgi:hypothetical protein
MIAAKCERCKQTIGECNCHLITPTGICKNVTKGNCCGDWDENGICKLTIPPKQNYDTAGKPLSTLQPCQGHDKETEKDENSATKFDGGKPQLSLIPQLALLEVGKSFTYGAIKYAKWNYSKGMEYTRYTDAALRHINQALRGNDIDEESGENKLMHLANAIASLMMCLDNQLTNKVTDDRNKNYQDASKN